MIMKKKILAGILAGAFVLGSGLFYYTAEAAETGNDWQPRAERFNKDGQRPHKPFNKEEAAEHIAKFAKLDKAKVLSLMENGYRPHDISMAGILADKSKKSVDSVLDMKKINNRWKDVASSLSVTLNKEDFPKPPRKPGHHHPEGMGEPGTK